MQFDSMSLQRVCFVLHFLMSILAVMSEMFGHGYTACQVFLIGISLWWYDDQRKSKALHLWALVTLVTICLDSILIGIRWESSLFSYAAIYTISGIFAITLLVLKPLMFFITLKNARVLDEANLLAAAQSTDARRPPPPPPTEGVQGQYQQSAAPVHSEKAAMFENEPMMPYQPPPPAYDASHAFNQFPDAVSQSPIPTKIDY